jgi:16S rRNA (guanine966-N2)-methyltransferase
MRIVAGTWRGRALAPPPGTTTRPTSDRVRQAIFDMLVHAPWSTPLDSMKVLDAFAGTGAMALEALSRGAASATYFEKDPAALKSLRANIAACKAEPRTRVIAADATRPPKGEPHDLAFLDPPYAEGLLLPAIAALQAAGWLAPNALLVVETARDDTSDLPGELLADRTHGQARIRITRLG